MKKIIAFIIVIALSFILISCNDVYPTEIQIEKNIESCEVGDKVQLKYTVLPSNATSKEVEWKTSDDSIAIVSSTGEVTAIKEGLVTISVISKENSEVKDSISLKINKTILPEVIQVENVITEAKVGDTVTFIASLLPADADNKDVLWSSSDEKIATVDANGFVTFKTTGVVIITIKAKADNSVTKEIRITVTDKLIAQEIKIDYENIPLYTGDEVKLNATVLPVGSLNTEVSWSSSDMTLATVDDSGLVKLLKNGRVVITCTLKNDKSIKSDVTLEVLEKILPQQITLSYDSKLYVGEKMQISATVLPENSQFKDLTWSVSDKTVASIDENGLITGIKAGKVIVSAISKYNENAVGELEVEVYELVKPTSIAIICDNNNLNVNKTVKLEIAVEPINAIVDSLTWTSSDEKVVTVDNAGNVTAISVGSAVIKAVLVIEKYNVNLEDEITITVTEDVNTIKAKLNNLLDKYLSSSKATINAATNDGNKITTQDYAFMFNGSKLEKFANVIMQDINSSSPNDISIYLKDDMLYMSANGTKGKYLADESEINETYELNSFDKLMENYTKFYKENDFFASLILVSVEDGNYNYKLDLSKYNGQVINTFNVDEIRFSCSFGSNDAAVVTLEYTSESLTKSLVLNYKGLDWLFTYPDDLDSYPDA